MCDQETLADNARWLADAPLSRRAFTRLAAATTFGAMLPAVGNAAAVSERDVVVSTPDGEADALFVHPVAGKHAAVLMWPDILGLRPAFRAMGRRLAESGYAVLVVNPFYRRQAAPVVGPGASFGDPKVRAVVLPLARSLSAETQRTDARAFVGWLDKQAAVDTARGVGTLGYCMGGPMTMRTAAAVPERVRAAASFHGGGLVTERADSPHLLVPEMRASYLFAVAENDDERDPAAKGVLREAFATAGLDAEIEVYPALHGWCPPDSAVYDEVQAERAWGRLLALFGKALG